MAASSNSSLSGSSVSSEISSMETRLERGFEREVMKGLSFCPD